MAGVASVVELKRIISSKEWFKVFDLPSRDCNITEVRAVFRQLALRVHPDKNPAPEATEAFKRLAQALEKATLECSPAGSGSSGGSSSSSRSKKQAEEEEERKGFCWWEQDWQFVEQWIKRQEEDFERENAQHRERMKAQQVLKRKKQEAANARVQLGVAHLKAKHGLGPPPAAATDIATDTATTYGNSHHNNNRGRFANRKLDDFDDHVDFQSARLRIDMQPPNTGLDDNGNPISEHETESEGEEEDNN